MGANISTVPYSFISKKSLQPPYQCVKDPERYCRIRILLLRVVSDPDPTLDLWQV
jgi:hypothetical protein